MARFIPTVQGVCVVLLLLLPALHHAVGTAPIKYFYVNRSTGPTLNQCKNICNNHVQGAFPATISSAAENAAIGAIFPSGLSFRGVIGGTRFTGDNSKFRWVTGPLGLEANGAGRVFFTNRTALTGHCVAGVYCNFSPGEPNADDSHPEGEEGQVEYTTSTQQWNDIPNGFPALSGCICQVPRTLTPSRTTTVAQSRSLQTTEFWFVPGRAFIYSFQNCTVLCASSRPGGFLATPTTEDDCNYANSVVPGDYQSGYIGARRLQPGARAFRWTTGPLGRLDGGLGAIFFTGATSTTGVCVPGFYCPFRTGEPSNSSAGEQYIVVISQSLGGGWNDNTDNNGEGCICQRNLRTIGLPSPTMTLSGLTSTRQLTRHTLSPTMSLSMSPSSTTTLSRSKSATASNSTTSSLSHRTKSLQAIVGAYLVNETVSGAALAAGDVAGNATFVIVELQLIGTEFSPLFNWSVVNCFANVADALVEMPMDGDAGRTVRAFVAQTTVVRVVSDTRALVYLQASSGVYSTLARRTVIGIGLRGACLARSYLTLHGELTVEAALSNPTDSTILTTTGAVTSIVAIINPVIAVQGQRNNIALAIQYCETQENGIDVFRSPTTLAFGDSSVSSYVGGAAMNHVIVAGMIAVMMIMVWVRRLGVSGSILEALSVIRCPGPLAFPILVLIEPTATCAIVTILFAEGRLVAIGYVSLLLCVTYPVVMLAYLLRGFKAERLQEIEPVMVGDDAGGGRVERFMFGSGKWIDDPTIPGSKGFCRRNGHFFKEYRHRCHWFIGIEVALGTAIGSLEGIKLGYGQCQGVLYAVTVLLGVYMIAFFVLRPCVSAFSNLFVLVLTALQVSSCVLLCLPRDSRRTSVAVDLSAVGSYLVLAKSVVDVCELVVFSMRSCKKWRDHREARLLAVVNAHADVDNKNEVEVPASLLKQPISILARRARELGAGYPMVAESGILDLLGADMYGRRGEVLGALEVVCGDNVRSMKTQAAHKEALDGVWRDWRGEGLRVPIELVALAVQLREVESTLRASEASRVTLRVHGDAGEVPAANGDGAAREMMVLEGYLKPLLTEADTDTDDSVEDYSPRGAPRLMSMPQDAPALRSSIYGINSDGYLVVEMDHEAFARDAEAFPEVDFSKW